MARYTISSAARLLGLHVNTLRKYERQGLILPARTSGNQRQFSDVDLARLEHIKRLVELRGVNLAGVEILLDVTDRVVALQRALLAHAGDASPDVRAVVESLQVVLSAIADSDPIPKTPMEESSERT